MKLIVEEGKLMMAYISGPRHNFLSLILAEDRKNKDFCLIDKKSGQVASAIQSTDIKRQISQGLEMSNRILNTSYVISVAEYCSGDSFSKEIYKELTFEILKKFTNKDW